MKPLLLVCIALAVVLSLSLGTGLTPAVGGPADAWTQNTWKVPAVQYDIITSVDTAAKKLSIEHQGGPMKHERDVTVDAFTEITVDGKKADISALKAGMRVRYILGSSGMTLASLEPVMNLR